jgi:3',5'-cyclic-AMP phosphodiesterase
MAAMDATMTNDRAAAAPGPACVARLAPSGRSVRLVQFTDTHVRVDPAASLRGAKPQPRLRACIEHARRLFFPADAIVVTGDIVHDEPAAYGVIDLMLGNLGVPVFLIPGNHDVPDELRRRLGHAPFQVGGEVVAGNDWHVVLLESWFAESVDGEGRLGPRQLAQLDRTLASVPAPHALVFLHHPPVPMDAAALDELALLDGPTLCETVARHARVRGVCWGHAHQALDLYAPGGLRLMCTPATVMQFRPRRETFQTDERPPGYRVIDLLPDGSIASEVVWLEGYRDPA